MAKVKVNVRSSDLKKALKGVEGRILTQVEAGLVESLGRFQAGAQARAPVDTGALQRSIKVVLEPTRLKGKVATGVPYAAHVEFGTTFQRAQPYMRPTVEAEREGFKKAIVEAVGRALK